MKNKKMELKVWADGIQRIVCGVNESTTCQDVVYALAHATGQTGRFTLVERWRSNERTLAPNEFPLKVLSKWGEYSNDVQLILKRSALTPKGSANFQQSNASHRELDIAHSFSPPLSPRQTFSPAAMRIPSPSGKSHHTKDIKKSLTFTGVHQGDPHGQDSDKKMEDSHVMKGSGRLVPSDDSREPILGDDNLGSLRQPNVLSDVSAYHDIERQKDDSSLTSEMRSPPHLLISTSNHKNKEPMSKNCSNSESERNILTNQHPLNSLTGLHFSSSTNFSATTSGATTPDNRHHASFKNNSHHNHQHPHAHHHHSTPPPSQNPSYGDLVRQMSPGNLYPSRTSNRPPPYPGHSSNSPKIFTGAMSPPPYRSPPTDKIQKIFNKSPSSNHPSLLNSLSPTANGDVMFSPTSHANNVEVLKSRRSLYPQFQSQIAASNNDSESKELGHNGLTSQVHEFKFQDKQESSGKGANQEVTKVVYDSRYRDLVKLVNMQRDTLNGQHTQITQFDAEITYWEEKQRERSRQKELIEVELRKTELISRDTDEEVAHLGQLHLEEDLELGHQQERTLRSELTLLRSKLANCETELLQCKNKIRLLLDEASEERRLLNRKEDEERDRERNILNEIETLQKEIRSKIQDYELKVSLTSSEKLSEEIGEIEALIAKKKKEVEELVHEMKEANLESLFIAPGEEIKHLEGGTARPGITRKIMGSPRELENAVPTSKNPHGVWV